MTIATERRGNRGDGSAMATLTQLPALRVLSEFPVPVIAVQHDGAILFANPAFAQMLGYTSEEVQALAFRDVYEYDDGQGVMSVIRRDSDCLVRLIDAEGCIIRAVMSRSALQREGDRLALITFQDASERLWLEGK